MSPAFSSTKQAAGYVLLLLVLLILPVLVGKRGLSSREQMYSSISWNFGPYPYIHQQIFEEKGDIDIAFVGSSHMLTAIDTPYVQQKLSEKLGRPANVVSLCWGLPGYDAVYFIVQDLLQHRRVHMIVLYDDHAANTPHGSAWRWVRLGDNAEAIMDLPLRFKIAYYYASILQMPRSFLSLIRPNMGPNLSPEKIAEIKQQHDGFPMAARGTMAMEKSYNERPDLFVPYVPENAAKPTDACIYSPQTAAQFTFADHPAAPVQTYFARKLLELTRAHSTRVAWLNIPTFSERKMETIPEGALWRDVFSHDADLMGIPPAKLFANLSDDEVHQLFSDTVHLNKNGQSYFTSIMTPSLIQDYEQTKP